MSAFCLQRILPVLLASALVCGSVLGEEGTDKLSAAELEKLDGLRLDYDVAREEIQQKQWVEPIEKLRSAYKAKMRQLLDKFSRGGDLAKSLAVRNASKTDPTISTIHPDVKEIAEVQQVFIEAQNKLQKRLDESLAKLARSHVARLSTIKEKLTKAQRFDSALVLEQEILKITLNTKGLSTSPKKIASQEIAQPNPLSDFEWEIKGREITITKFVGGGKRVVIPKMIDFKPVVKVGDHAFHNCGNLTSITIPDGVTSIGNNAFHNCSNLTSITIPDSVTSIGGYAFYSCQSLVSITVLGDVVSIGSYTFHNCSSLTDVTISDKVQSIEERAFSLCKSLESIVFLGNSPKFGREIFDDPRNPRSTPTPMDCIIYRQFGATGWGDTWCGRSVKLISEKP